MDKKLEGLLKEKEKAENKLKQIKPRLGHPHGEMQSAHDLAEQEFRVWSSYLEEIGQEIAQLKLKKN